jgi:protein TonB
MLFFHPKQESSVDFVVYESPKVAQNAPTISRPKELPQKKAQPKGVFGISRRAVASQDDQAPEIKTGNTIAKETDTKTLQAGDPDELPIPADEVLVTQMPEIKNEFRIPYPPEAKQKGIQGAVVMDILIDHQGNVREAKLIDGPGAGLNEAALEAVRNFKFSPAMMQDKPVAVRIRYAYRFVLER